MAQFSIDVFSFITLESLSGGRGGSPELPQSQVELVQRAGVEGTGFIDLASKGTPFQMRSLIDAPDEASASSVAEAYRSVVGQQLVNIVWRDIDFNDAHSVKYVVLRIEADKRQVMATVTGGLNVADGSPAVIVECIWTLIPVRVEE